MSDEAPDWLNESGKRAWRRAQAYTPTTQEVATGYVCGTNGPPEMRSAAFRLWLAEHDRQVKAEALRDAASDLEWVQPEACPCDHPEDCCGSEASCDAMQPTIRVVGEDWLRKRADRVATGKPAVDTACNCPRFGDTGGFRIADLTCPVHGINGTEPGDGYWDNEVESGADSVQLDENRGSV